MRCVATHRQKREHDERQPLRTGDLHRRRAPQLHEGGAHHPRLRRPSAADTDLAGGATLSPENTTVTATIPETVTNTTLTLGVVEGVTVRVAGQELDLSALTDQSGYISLTIE